MQFDGMVLVVRGISCFREGKSGENRVGIFRSMGQLMISCVDQSDAHSFLDEVKHRRKRDRLG